MGNTSSVSSVKPATAGRLTCSNQTIETKTESKGKRDDG